MLMYSSFKAAYIHLSYQKQYENVAAMMSIPAGMTNASTESDRRLTFLDGNQEAMV